MVPEGETEGFQTHSQRARTPHSAPVPLEAVEPFTTYFELIVAESNNLMYITVWPATAIKTS